MKNTSLILFKYHKDKLIHKTSQKQVWQVSDYLTKQKYIIKLHPPPKVITRQFHQDIPSIFREATILKEFMGFPGIPFMIWSGTQENTKLAVIQQLGQSLQYIFSVSCEYKFSLKTICNLAIQTIKILKNLHQKEYICDKITAKRLQFGKGKNCHKIYINDFSQCILKSQLQQQKKSSAFKIKNKIPTSQTYFTQFSQNCFKSQFANLMLNHSIQEDIQEWDQYKDIQSVIKMSIQFFNCNLHENYVKGKKEYHISPNLFNKNQNYENINTHKQQKNIKKFVSIIETLLQDRQSRKQLKHFKYISLIQKIKFQNNLSIKNSFDYDWFFNKKTNNIHNVKKKIKCLKCLYQNIKFLKLQNESLIIEKIYNFYSKTTQIDYINSKHRKALQTKKDLKLGQTQNRLCLDNDDLQEDMQYYYEDTSFSQCKCRII